MRYEASHLLIRLISIANIVALAIGIIAPDYRVSDLLHLEHELPQMVCGFLLSSTTVRRIRSVVDSQGQVTGQTCPSRYTVCSYLVPSVVGGGCFIQFIKRASYGCSFIQGMQPRCIQAPELKRKYVDFCTQ